MASPKIILILILVSSHFSILSEERTYTFEELWSGNITLSAFPFGVENLIANITVYVNETVTVRIYSNGEVTITLIVGSSRRRSVVGNNETISIVAEENVSNITISIVNTRDYPVTIFGNSTITITPPKTENSAASPIITREQAKIYGILSVIIPIAIMILRARRRKVKVADSEILEYFGVES